MVSRIAIAILLGLASSHCTTSFSSKKDDAPAEDGDDEPADVPVEVSGAFLTCGNGKDDFESVRKELDDDADATEVAEVVKSLESKEIVIFGCAVTDEEKRRADITPFEVITHVVDENDVVKNDAPKLRFATGKARKWHWLWSMPRDLLGERHVTMLVLDVGVNAPTNSPPEGGGGEENDPIEEPIEEDPEIVPTTIGNYQQKTEISSDLFQE